MTLQRNMNTILHFLILGLDIYLWIIIAAIMMSWLVIFGVLNIRNKWVRQLGELLNRVTDPPIRFLRRFIPPLGGMDLTPMVLIFGIYIVQNFLHGLLR